MCAITITVTMLIWFVAVRCMMYGFGDDQNPYSESVDLLEDLVIEYISEMVRLFSYICSMYSYFLSVLKKLWIALN